MSKECQGLEKVAYEGNMVSTINSWKQYKVAPSGRWVTGMPDKDSEEKIRPLHWVRDTRDDKNVITGLESEAARSIPINLIEDERDVNPAAAWQMNIDPEDPISCTFLFATSKRTRAFFIWAHLLVWAFVILFSFYLSNKNTAMLYSGSIAELVAIFIVFIGVVFPGISQEIKNDITNLPKIYKIGRLLQPELKRQIYISLFIQCLDLFQSLSLKVLSVYVGLWLSDNDLLNAVLNVVALDYLASMDSTLLKIYCHIKLGGQKINLMIVDIHHNFHGCFYPETSAFWDNSDTSANAVQDKLNNPLVSNEDKLEFLCSGSKGFGFAGTWPQKHHVLGCRGTDQVGSAFALLEVLDWEVIEAADLRGTYGRCVLKGLSLEDWELSVDGNMRGMLIRSFPEECINYTLTGGLWCNGWDIGLVHVKVLLQMARHSPKLEGLYLKNNKMIDNECAKYIAHFLKTNTTIKILALDKTGITDEGAELILEALKENPMACSFCLQIGGGQEPTTSYEMVAKMQQEIGKFHGNWFAEKSIKLARGVHYGS